MKAWMGWAIYTVVAVWAQEWCQGMDFFSPGLIVFLQTDHWKAGLWSALIWGIIQEGTGSLSFGAVLVFDAGLIGMFVMGKWLLEPENPLFVVALSMFLVLWREVVIMGLASLQDLIVSWSSLSFMALQCLVYILTWALISPLFSRMVVCDQD